MVLLTGGTGLIGSHLLYRLLEKGEDVRALYRNRESLEAVSRVFAHYSPHADALMDRVDWVEADITDIGSMEPCFENIKKVYHAAGMISFDPRDKKQLWKINVEGTANLTHLCLKHRVDKLCHLSSISAVGPSKKGEWATEENDWNDSNVSVYGLSKFEGELEVWRASQEGLAVVILNPGVVLGPGFWTQGSGSIFSYAAKGRNYHIPGGTGFVGVNELADAAISAMESPLKSQRFIVVGQNLSYGELLEKVAQGLGVAPPSKELPFPILEFLWRLDWLVSTLSGKKRRLTRSLVRGMRHREWYDSQNIKRELGIDLNGLDHEIRSCCSHFRDSQ